MKSKFKFSFIIIICISFAAFLFYKYHKINYGVPLDYNIQRYYINDLIELDDFEIKLDSVDNNISSDGLVVTMDINIRNSSTEEKSLEDMFYLSKLVCGTSVIDVPVFNDKKSDSRTLKGKESKNIVLQYIIPNEDKNRNMKFYIPKTLYQNEIKDDLSDLKMCEKYIELTEKND
ncbi:MAG: hypothetical protein ACERKV_04180 [Clostridiaceae bacterium]